LVLRRPKSYKPGWEQGRLSRVINDAVDRFGLLPTIKEAVADEPARDGDRRRRIGEARMVVDQLLATLSRASDLCGYAYFLETM
jgi:hypothetical protein